MSLCMGKTQAGKACKSSVPMGKKYCKTHDKDYQAAKKAKNDERKAKSFKTFEYIMARVGSELVKKGTEEDTLVKSIKSHGDHIVTGYVQKAIIPCIKELAVMEHDDYGYPKRETPFCRKIWMMLSWHLSDDTKSYMNMAMTCKGFYKVFVLDKVRWYVHPLKGEMLSPLLFFRPVFRVLSLKIPEDLDDLLETLSLPKIEDFLAVYEEEYGMTKNEVILNRRKSDAIQELLQHLVHATLAPEQEFEEAIEGAGLFGEYEKEASFRFYKPPCRYKLFKKGKSTFVMFDTDWTPAFERTLLDLLCPYDGQYLIKLMRVI